jgi:hypothetical protein
MRGFRSRRADGGDVVMADACLGPPFVATARCADRTSAVE